MAKTKANPKDRMRNMWAVDIEAHRGGPDGYPIEIALHRMSEPTSTINLTIKPDPSWDMSGWSKYSERVHGISREDIERGVDAKRVATYIAAALGDHAILVSDSSNDQAWFNHLMALHPRKPQYEIQSVGKAFGAAMSADEHRKFRATLKSTPSQHIARDDAIRLANAIHSAFAPTISPLEHLVDHLGHGRMNDAGWDRIDQMFELGAESIASFPEAYRLIKFRKENAAALLSGDLSISLRGVPYVCASSDMAGLRAIAHARMDDCPVGYDLIGFRIQGPFAALDIADMARPYLDQLSDVSKGYLFTENEIILHSEDLPRALCASDIVLHCNPHDKRIEWEPGDHFIDEQGHLTEVSECLGIRDGEVLVRAGSRYFAIAPEAGNIRFPREFEKPDLENTDDSFEPSF